MSEQQFAADDGFYVEITADAGRVLDLIDPDQALTDEALVVVPLFPSEWIEHTELGLPGAPGPAGPLNFLILQPGDALPAPGDDTPTSVVYRIQA